MGRRLDLKDQATEIIRLAGLARSHFEVWRVYTDQTNRDDLFDALDQFADFVNLDQHAHQELCLLYLGTLFETNGGTINLAAMIEEAAVVDDRFLTENARSLLDDAHHIIKKVHLLRNNAVAHRSATLSRTATFAKADLSPNDLRQLVDEAEQIAYAIGRAFGVAPFALAVLAPTDLQRLFTRVLPP